MDLNYLFHRRGIAAHMSKHAACDKSRAAHGAFARAYSARIDRIQRDLRGAAA
jgi:hypothetical protein